MIIGAPWSYDWPPRHRQAPTIKWSDAPRASNGLRRVEGDWRIVDQHEPVPCHMDGSFIAAVGLSPEDG